MNKDRCIILFFGSSYTGHMLNPNETPRNNPKIPYNINSIIICLNIIYYGYKTLLGYFQQLIRTPS